MEHQQQRDDPALGQAWLRAARFIAAVELMRLPLWLEGFTEIIHFAKYFGEPIQHDYLHVGRLAHLKNH
jgi:hypothetical protein